MKTAAMGRRRFIWTRGVFAAGLIAGGLSVLIDYFLRGERLLLSVIAIPIWMAAGGVFAHYLWNSLLSKFGEPPVGPENPTA